MSDTPAISHDAVDALSILLPDAVVEAVHRREEGCSELVVYTGWFYLDTDEAQYLFDSDGDPVPGSALDLVSAALRGASRRPAATRPPCGARTVRQGQPMISFSDDTIRAWRDDAKEAWIKSGRDRDDRILALCDALLAERARPTWVASDEDSRRLVDEARQAASLARSAAPASCTGTTATWCPVHGDCTCPHHDDGEVEFSDGEHSCPLHSITSLHAQRLAPSADDVTRLVEAARNVLTIATEYEAEEAATGPDDIDAALFALGGELNRRIHGALRAALAPFDET